ncbi:MAG TPA: hypothetical protein VER79_02305 [Candidatus Limnocylindrales bacterium]|nr:hypothetical protein [Candidatus Limnocylindrales bacterium]
MQPWEYLTTFVEAQAEREQEYLLQTRSWKSGVPRNTPEAMIPQMNALGAQGWELVHMEPVVVGKNADILIHTDNTNKWTSTYFCVFKRPVSA